MHQNLCNSLVNMRLQASIGGSTLGSWGIPFENLPPQLVFQGRCVVIVNATTLQTPIGASTLDSGVTCLKDYRHRLASRINAFHKEFLASLHSSRTFKYSRGPFARIIIIGVVFVFRLIFFFRSVFLYFLCLIVAFELCVVCSVAARPITILLVQEPKGCRTRPPKTPQVLTTTLKL